jgi:hypothetical protein
MLMGQSVIDFAAAHGYIPVGRVDIRSKRTAVRHDGTTYEVTIPAAHYYVTDGNARTQYVLDISYKPTAASAIAMMKRYLRSRKASK